MTNRYADDMLPRGDQVVREYEQLIELANQSAEAIDAMQTERDKGRTTSLIGLICAYVLIGLPLAFIANLKNGAIFGQSNISNTIVFIGCLVSSMLSIFALFLAWSRLKRVRYVRKALDTEVEIHHRLLSLIDEQKKRVETFSHLSPVSMATLEMKVMRLHRQRP